MSKNNYLKVKLDFSTYLLKYLINLIKYPFMNIEDIFGDIYKKNIWNNSETYSGDSSTFEQTKVLRKELELLFKEYNITSILDIPCGDFNWMKSLDLKAITYIGGDIVEDLVLKNSKDFSTYGVFKKLDICSDLLPKVDLVFCRDCLVHLSHKKVIKAINNIKKSGATYILVTTFPKTKKNKNIITGAWRALNMEKIPFDFPKPLVVINEKFKLRGNRFYDKSMALWRLQDLEISF